MGKAGPPRFFRRRANGSVSYAYSPTGNRLVSAGAANFSYDADGQLYNGYGLYYSFDYEHRFIGTGPTPYNTYDGAGNRVQMVYGTTTNRYVYDAKGNVLAVADGNSRITGYFIYGAGLLEGITAAGAGYCYHFDANGNTTALTDSSQNVVNSYAYDPFGAVTNQAENVPQPFKFVGQYGIMADPDGFYYMRARYYDPGIGRFISEDPSGLDGEDTNLYAYTGNNPIIRVDPNGQWWVGAVAGAFAGAFGGYTSGLISGGSLKAAILGGLAGGVAGASVGGALPDFLGFSASSAAGAAGGSIVGGIVGGATGALVSGGVSGNISGETVLTGAAMGGFSGAFAAPGIGAAATATGGSELGMALIGSIGSIMGDTIGATGQAMWWGSSCGK